jgi:hypothetical protein
MSMEMPSPTEAHKRLHVFAGNWKGDETLEPSPWGAGGPAIGKSTMRVECDGFFVSQDYVEEKDGKLSYRGHGVFGYDPVRQKYSWYWVDSMGMVPPAPSWGTWDGDRLVFSVESPQGIGRYVYDFEGNDRYRFKIENSFDDGKTWCLFMSADYRRVA